MPVVAALIELKRGCILASIKACVDRQGPAHCITYDNAVAAYLLEDQPSQ